MKKIILVVFFGISTLTCASELNDKDTVLKMIILYFFVITKQRCPSLYS